MKCKSASVGNDALLFITKLKGFSMKETSSCLDNSYRVFVQNFVKVCCVVCSVS